MNDRAVFVWNTGSYAERLREEGYAVATTKEELRQFRRRSRLRNAPLVVLVEWQGADARLSELDGLNLIIDMFEVERSIPKIALCSFLPRQTLMDLGDARGAAAQIMFPFVRLPSSISSLVEAAENMWVPSRMVHNWIRDHVLSPHPFLMWEHNLRQQKSKGLEGLRDGLTRLRRSVIARQGMITEAFEDFDGFTRILDEGLQAIAEGRGEKAYGIVRDIQHQLREAQRRSESGISKARSSPLDIILIEDDVVQLTEVAEGLDPYFSSVVAFSSGREALTELTERSERGEPYDAVIADWDLRVEGRPGGLMQPLQGPDVLLRAVDLCNGPLVGLTSLPAGIASGILNTAPADVRARISWFPKPEEGRIPSRDFERLAHHIWERSERRRLLREETPDKAPWRKHGLTKHYVSVRMSRPQRQTSFFLECSAQADEIIAAYTEREEHRDVSEAPYFLSLNALSGESLKEGYSFDRLKDVLVGRLVFLSLYGQQKVGSRDFRKVFSMIYPELDRKAIYKAEEKPGTDRYPASFVTGYPAVLGLPTTKNRIIDLGNLRLMPHEIEWLREKAVSLDLPPVLNSEEEELVRELDDQVIRIERTLEDKVSESSIRIEVDVPFVESNEMARSPVLAMGEEAVRRVELIGEEVVSLNEAYEGNQTVGEAVNWLADQIESLLADARYTVLFEKSPVWKNRIEEVLKSMK